MKFLDKIELLK